jgi:hypothetical protein
MKRGAVVLILLAACSAPPPAPPTWTLWQVNEIIPRGGPTQRVTTPKDADLDRTACELVLAKRTRALHHRIGLIGAKSTGGADGATYHMGDTMYSEHYVCVKQGQRP